MPLLTRILFLLALGWLAAPASAQPVVFVSVLPQKLFVERVAGERVVVEAMVRPGFDPHTYEPTAQQLARVASSPLYVRVGVPFETAWLPRLQRMNSQMRVVDARQGLELLAADGHGHDHAPGRRDEALDPHIWTDPRQVIGHAAQLRDELIRLLPQYAAEFIENHARFVADLAALDHTIETELSGLASRSFMVFHPAWGYFSRRYGLHQMAVEHEGKEPGARQLTVLADQARRERVRLILVQSQASRKLARRLAVELGLKLAEVDPLSADYFGTLRRLAALLREMNG